MARHVVSPRVYFAVFAALIAFTLLTTGAALLDLGPFNTLVAITIAVCKASLVVLFFMHAGYGVRLTWVFIAAGVVWLAILMALTMGDVLTRTWIPFPPPWTSVGGP